VISARFPARRFVPIGVVALVAGAAVAQASGGGAATTPIAAPVSAAATRPATVLTGAPRAPAAVPVPLPCEPAPRDRNAARTPPSDALKNAFGILRRDREDQDALPARALKALKAQGLEPVDAAAARLLRADGDARAWVVPVPDIGQRTPFGCVRGSAPGKPREGLAVVSLGGAPAGGGGALRDLQRGLAAAALDPCAGTARNMLGVSGIVPDGVEAVFVTAADGSSTRADVHDNGYAFVLPRSRRPEQRYVVWSASDGAPHVQPLPAVFAGARDACPAMTESPLVTPDPWGAGCGPFSPPAILALPPIVTRPRRASRPLSRTLDRGLAAARRRMEMRRSPHPCVLLSPQPGVVFRGPVTALPVPVPVPRPRPQRTVPARPRGMAPVPVSPSTRPVVPVPTQPGPAPGAR
jgi:hypothetical protein